MLLRLVFLRPCWFCESNDWIPYLIPVSFSSQSWTQVAIGKDNTILHSSGNLFKWFLAQIPILRAITSLGFNLSVRQLKIIFNGITPEHGKPKPSPSILHSAVLNFPEFSLMFGRVQSLRHNAQISNMSTLWTFCYHKLIFTERVRIRCYVDQTFSRLLWQNCWTVKTCGEPITPCCVTANCFKSALLGCPVFQCTLNVGLEHVGGSKPRLPLLVSKCSVTKSTKYSIFVVWYFSLTIKLFNAWTFIAKFNFYLFFSAM